MQKKPAIYLVVILPILIGGFMLPIFVFPAAYARLHNVSQANIPALSGLLITLPFIFLWIPAALLLSNLVLSLISPLRRIADQYATRSRSPSYLDAQKMLSKVARWAVLIFLPFIFLGFVL
jgi:hypothetical protein